MKKQILFIHGAGTGAYEEDKKMADSLQRLLGPGYEVNCPAMQDEDNPDYKTWKQQIVNFLAKMKGDVILVGHSMGGSVLIKSLTSIKSDKAIAGIFLIAAPFWGGDGWKYKGYRTLALPTEVKGKLPEETPIFLYHSRDDENVPYKHLELYAKKLPHATVRTIDGRGHQLNNDLAEVAADIQQLR